MTDARADPARFYDLGPHLPEQVSGLFRTVRGHLAPGGRCILTAFRPNRDPEAMLELWSTPGERVAWEVETHDGSRVVCTDRRTGARAEPLVLYPELVYRRFRGNVLAEEAVLRIAMRCWYPDELRDRVEGEGFRLTGAWGGYAGEVYGEGSELVMELGLSQ